MKAHRRSSTANQAMYKLIMIGDSGAGKSCLLVRYIRDQFNQQYNVTVGTDQLKQGVQFASKSLKIDENYKVKLQIWDTAGQQSFRSIVKSFYRNSAAVILVYNIAKRKTFQNLNSWIHQAKQNSPKDAIFILIGTHLDLESQRQVKKQQAELWVKQQSITMFFETSAKTSLNVAKAFDQIAKQLFTMQLQRQRQKGDRQSRMTSNMNTIQISNKKNQQNKCC